MDSDQRGSVSLNFKLNMHTWHIPVLLYLQYRFEAFTLLQLNITIYLILLPYTGEYK